MKKETILIAALILLKTTSLTVWIALVKKTRRPGDCVTRILGKGAEDDDGIILQAVHCALCFE